MEKSQSKVRIYALDYARAFCLILVIVFHVLLGLRNSGIDVPDWAIGLNNALRTVRMPVFFFASGVLYALIFESGRARFWNSLLVGLVIPFLVWSEIHGLGKILFSAGTTNPIAAKELAHILWAPFDHFWFIYSLIVIRVVVKVSSYREGILTVIFLVSLTYYTLYRLGYHDSNLLTEIARGMIYFIIGLAFARRYDMEAFKVSKPSQAIVVAAVGTLLFATARILEKQVFNASAPLVARFLEIAVEPAIGVVTIMVVAMALPAPSGPFGRTAATLAQGSLVIYMLHPMIAAVTRTVLVKLGVSDWLALFGLCMAVATLVPAAIYLTASRLRLLPWLALGPNRGAPRREAVRAEQLAET